MPLGLTTICAVRSDKWQLSDKIMTLYEVGFAYFAGVTMKFVFRDGVFCAVWLVCVNIFEDPAAS